MRIADLRVTNMDLFFVLLSAFFQTAPFVMAFVLALCFCLFCITAYNSPVVGVATGVVVYLLKQLLPSASLNIGLNLSPFDFYFVLLGVVVIIRMLNGHFPFRDGIVRLWLVLGLVWCGLFLVGLVKFKTAAGVEFRSTFYSTVSVFYLISYRLDQEQSGGVFRVLYFGAFGLVGLAIYRWVSVALGEFGFWYDPTTPLRVLDSGATLVIAMAMLPGLAMWMKLNATRTVMMLVAPMLLLAVMVLGHRSVWVAGIAALGVAWLLAAKRRKGGQLGLMVPLAVGALTLGALFVLAPRATVTQEFQRSVAETQRENSTIAWRVNSWKSLVEDWVSSGPAVWPAGKPFGTSKRRYIESQGIETEVAAHSHYVTLLIRGGIIGLFCYVAAQLIAARRLLRDTVAVPPWLGAELPLLFVLGNAVYALVYSPDYMQFMFMGLAYSLAVPAAESSSRTRSVGRVSVMQQMHVQPQLR